MLEELEHTEPDRLADMIKDRKDRKSHGRSYLESQRQNRKKRGMQERNTEVSLYDLLDNIRDKYEYTEAGQEFLQESGSF